MLNFELKPSYWCEKSLIQKGEQVNDEIDEITRYTNGTFEAEPVGLDASVKIKNLTKVNFYN